jgi:hypothetical protein
MPVLIEPEPQVEDYTHRWTRSTWQAAGSGQRAVNTRDEPEGNDENTEEMIEPRIELGLNRKLS